MLRIDIGCNFAYKLHKNSDSVCANEGKSDSKMRVVLFQLYLFEMLLNAFVDLVRNLSEARITAFSGRNKKSLKTSIKRVPKGTI